MEDKKINFYKIIKLYGLYARMDLAWFLRDTKVCLMAICAELISNLAAVAGVFMLSWRFDGVGGMNKFEVLLMLGYVTTVTGIFQTFFANCNTGHISRRIGRGQLEHSFLQPLPLPIQFLAEGFIPVSGSSNLISGIVIVCMALKNLRIGLQWWWVVLFVLSILLSVSILLLLLYLFSCAAFYAPVQAEEISMYVADSTGILGGYPLSGMALAVQIPLITIFPAGLLGWFPTMALLGRPPLSLPAFYPLIVAAVLFFITYKLFRKGLKHYVKTGANRYSAIGHRR